MTAEQDYYARHERANGDGSPLFANDYDQASEGVIRDRLAAIWRCSVHPFGRLCPVDFYAIRDGRLVGVLELKTRTHDAGRYPTVFLNVRKWLALTMAANGLGCPAVFVVRFTDSLRHIPVAEVDAGQVRIGGTNRIVKSHTDIEPVIEVPIEAMLLTDG